MDEVAAVCVLDLDFAGVLVADVVWECVTVTLPVADVVGSLLNVTDLVARNVDVAVWSLLSVTDFDRRMLGVDVSSSLMDTVSDSRSVRVSVIGCVSVGGTYSHIGSIVYGRLCAVAPVVPLYPKVPASL